MPHDDPADDNVMHAARPVGPAATALGLLLLGLAALAVALRGG